MRQTRGPVTLAAISERQHISLSYLEQLFGMLRRRKLVSSVRGPGGGYRLAQPMQSVTVADIVIAMPYLGVGQRISVASAVLWRT